MVTLGPGTKAPGSLEGAASKVGGQFGKALILVVSVKVAELVVEQGVRGVKALWAWFSEEKKADAKAKREMKSKPLAQPKDQAA